LPSWWNHQTPAASAAPTIATIRINLFFMSHPSRLPAQGL
jgi:hypothetical protein